MSLTVELNAKPHEAQKIVLNNPANYKVIRAGKRFGKTVLAVMDLAKEAGRHQDMTMWYLALTHNQAESLGWQHLKKMIPPQLIKRKSETLLSMTLTSGTTIRCLGTENEDVLRGTTLDMVVMDEADYMNKAIWPNILVGQLANSKLNKALFISTPNRHGRNWFSSFWDEAKRKEESGDKRWAAFYYTILDNPYYTKEMIKDIQEQNTEDTWQLEYLALDVGISGRLISEWNEPVHKGKFECEHQKTKVRGIDWGIDHPTVCIWGDVCPTCKMVFIKDEFCKPNLLISDSSAEIKRRWSNKDIEWTVIDPSTQKRNSQTGLSDLTEFNRYDIRCIPGDNQDRGYDIMKMFFKTNMIKVDPSCRSLISQIKNYNRGEKEGDDCLDALRYMLVRIHDTYFQKQWDTKKIINQPMKTVPNECSFYDKEFKSTFQEKASVRNWMYEGVL